MRKAITYIAAMAVWAMGCTDNPATTPAQGLSLSSESAQVAYNETSVSVTINAHRDWTLSIAEGNDWIFPSITSGRAGVPAKVDFEITSNSGHNSRTGKVSIKATGETDPYVFTITQTAENVLTGVNKWIYETLSKSYYWNDVVKATLPPSNALAYTTFLEQSITALPWSRVQDSSHGENPPTIDGQWNAAGTGRLAAENGTPYIYSWVERVSGNTRAANGVETTYGFGAARFNVANTSRYMFLVTWIQPGGPADKAGMKRGMWIELYNGATLDRSASERFGLQMANPATGGVLNFALSDGTPYNLIAVTMKVSPIIVNKVITTPGGRRVAYMVYNGFEMGAGNEFHDEMRNVFGGFKSAGAGALVLDLRYNPGGYVPTSLILASLVADATPVDVYVKLLRNKSTTGDNPTVYRMRNEPNKLGLRKIYALVSARTASASEMVINALRGLYGKEAVVLIGAKTNGKNVGMDQQITTVDGASYEMWPITFKALNTRDQCDFAGGFAPDYYMNEFLEAAKGGTLHELGDPQERLLGAALTLIDGGTVSADDTTRTYSPALLEATPLPEDPRRGGAKEIPDTEETK